jgi:hypothetical protein
VKRLGLLLPLLCCTGPAMAQRAPAPAPEPLLKPDASPDATLPALPLRRRGSLPGANRLFPPVVGPKGGSVLYAKSAQIDGKRQLIYSLWEGGNKSTELLTMPKASRLRGWLPDPVFSADGKRFLLAARDERKRISAYLLDRRSKRKLAAELHQVSGMAFVGKDVLLLEVNQWKRPPGYVLRRILSGGGPARVLSKDDAQSADGLCVSPSQDRAAFRVTGADGQSRLRVLDLAKGSHHDSPAFAGSDEKGLLRWGGAGRAIFHSALVKGAAWRQVLRWPLQGAASPLLAPRESLTAVLDADHVLTLAQHCLLRRLSDGARFVVGGVAVGGRGKTLVYYVRGLDGKSTYFVADWTAPAAKAPAKKP